MNIIRIIESCPDLIGALEKYNDGMDQALICLNYFETLESARKVIEDWRMEYNEECSRKKIKSDDPSQYENILNKAEYQSC